LCEKQGAISKITRVERAGGVAQDVQHKQEALSSHPNTAKKKKKKEDIHSILFHYK
jgi:hypothetical protein